MANASQLLTALEAAKELKTSRRTVLRMVEHGDLPYVRKLDGTNGAYLFDATLIKHEARRREREKREREEASA